MSLGECRYKGGSGILCTLDVAASIQQADICIIVTLCLGW
jgi:hypothetical protein